MQPVVSHEDARGDLLGDTVLFGAASVEATSLSIAQVLGERYPFSVPRYQRSYAWEDEAVGYFVQDIQSLLDRPAGESSHFFGGVVCVEINNHQKVRPLSYEIVDGQQRLATFMLGLSCVVEVAERIRARCVKSNPAAAASAQVLRDETRDDFVTWKDANVSAGTAAVRCRMQLSTADDATFQALVLGTAVPAATRESHRLLAESRVALLAMTMDYVGSSGSMAKRIERLLRIRQALVHDSHVIHIVSKERTQANRLFSVLNHRGESLSDADLLRSRSLELLDGFEMQHETAAVLWDQMLGESAKNISAYLRTMYPSRTGRRVQGDLFESVSKQFYPQSAPTSVSEAESIVETIEGFRDEFNVYLRLVRGEWPYERPPGTPNKVRAWQVDRLKRLVLTLQHELALPVLLAAADSVPEDAFAELVYMIEIFAFRYKIICGAHATRPTNVYNAESAKIRAAADGGTIYALKPFRDSLRGLIEDHAGDALFKQLLVDTLRYNNPSQRANIREFLTTIEDHRSWWDTSGAKQANSKPKPTMTKIVDLEDSTIEHIYPYNAKAANVSSAMEPLKHTIGNLTFFGALDNSNAGNKDFASKKPAYKASAIRMTSDLAELADWTAVELAARQKRLLEQSVRVFVL